MANKTKKLEIMNLKLVNTDGKKSKKSAKNRIGKLLFLVRPFFFTIKLVRKREAKINTTIPIEVPIFNGDEDQIPCFNCTNKKSAKVRKTTIV